MRLVLDRLGPPSPETGERRLFPLADFQEVAVARATEVIRRRRGVLIADVTGAGKTFVALALVEAALNREESVLVTVPAALARTWAAPLRRLARTRGAISWGIDTAPFGSVTDGNRPAIALISHSRLSRGTFPAERLAGSGLVVVDEAHAFRSPATRRYRALSHLCAGSHVVLLTATPVNNSLLDLYFQLRLFVGDASFRDLGVPDLAATFRGAVRARAGSSADGLRRVLDDVMIRRTRSEMAPDKSRSGIALPLLSTEPCGPRLCDPARPSIPSAYPLRAPPVAIRYEFPEPHRNHPIEAARALEALALPWLRLGTYGIPDATIPAGASDLVRLGLLKRLESGVGAYRASVARQARYLRSFLENLQRGSILTAGDHFALSRSDRRSGGDADQLFLGELVLRPAAPSTEFERLRLDAGADLRILEAELARLASFTGDADPKLLRLRTLLNDELQGEKVVIFTEFRETARFLWRSLVARGGVALVDGGGAFLGRSACGRAEALARFAPLAAGLSPPPVRETVDLLIATDVLAEGLNLQDARCVVSYDLPWNPVRLIQRLGRVDRLGSPHREIRSYHFLPDQGLELILGLLRRLTAKLDAIGRSVGGVEPILDGAIPLADQAGLAEALAAGDPDALERIVALPAGAARFDDLRRAARRIIEDGRVSPSIGGAPSVAVIGTFEDVPEGVLIGGRTGPDARADRRRWLFWRAETDRITEDNRLAARILLHAMIGTAGPGPSRNHSPPDRSTLLRALAESNRWAAAGSVTTICPRIPPRGSAGHAARLILQALSTIPGGPDSALCDRADHVLRTLAEGLDAGTETELSTVCRGDIGTVRPVGARPVLESPTRQEPLNEHSVHEENPARSDRWTAELLLERIESVLGARNAENSADPSAEGPASAGFATRSGLVAIGAIQIRAGGCFSVDAERASR